MNASTYVPGIAGLRSKAERDIATKLVDDALAAGYLVNVYDGEEYPLADSSDRAAILDAMASTDHDVLSFRNPHTRKFVGWVALIYGNDCDLISDNTDNDATNALLAGAESLAREYGA